MQGLVTRINTPLDALPRRCSEEASQPQQTHPERSPRLALFSHQKSGIDLR